MVTESLSFRVQRLNITRDRRGEKKEISVLLATFAVSLARETVIHTRDASDLFAERRERGSSLSLLERTI